MSPTAGTPINSTGRLGRTLRARSTASPEAPFVIEHREALIYMLCEAAELEHGLMCEYLYAAFSLKETPDEGVTPAQLEAMERWRAAIVAVATQEMLHLTLVQNLLSAIGMSPHLSRPDLPHPARHFPPGVVVTLLPFSEQALRHFIYLERPEGMDIEDAEGIAALERAAPVMEEGDIVPRLQDFATVGHLYRAIEDGFRHLEQRYGAERLFVGPPRAQATRRDFSWPELAPVTDLDSALHAIETVVEQGEGPRGDWRTAHFGRFLNVLDEYLALREADPAFEPARPVLVARVRPPETGQAVPLVTDPATMRCADLFNVAYEILLQVLYRYFAHTEESDEEVSVLADTAVSIMFEAIRPLGRLLTRLPLGPEHPGRTAGPTFELFYQSDYLLPHRHAAWVLIEERLREAAAYCERTRLQLPAGQETLQAVGAVLKKLADTLAASA